MPPLRINRYATLPHRQLQFSAIRAQGPGGQNVNKVSSAIQLRFDIPSSDLPAIWKERLMRASDRRISANGTVTIKAQRYRQQDNNRQDALERLRELILRHVAVQKPRRATKPSKAARLKRLRDKSHQSKIKQLRRAPVE